MNIPILLYHSVSDDSTSVYQPWAITPARFEQHMAYLREQGYQPMTLTNIADAIRSGGTGFPEHPVAITFDDGMADFLHGAVPILGKYNFPATLFVTTGYVGHTSRWLTEEGEGDRPMLSWKEIASIKNVEIGTHSHTHPQLDIIPLYQAREEILLSKKMLEQQLAIPINTFAFPHGYHTARLVELIKQAGYMSACIVGHAMATDASNLFALPRIMITSDVNTTILEQYLKGTGLRNQNLWRSVLKTTWRVIRQMRTTLNLN